MLPKRARELKGASENNIIRAMHTIVSFTIIPLKQQFSKMVVETIARAHTKRLQRTPPNPNFNA